MSIQALAWVIKFSQARLGARLVLISIANHANEDGEDAWPSVATIAKEAHMSDREVQRAIPKLIAIGELEVERNCGRNGVHLYRLPKIKQANLFSKNVTSDKMSPVTKRSRGVTNSEKYIPKMSPEPSFNLPLKQPLNTKEQQPHFVLPNWIPEDVWKGFEEMRRKVGAPMTDRARNLAVKKLDGFRSEGFSPSAIMEQSILNSWRGLFPIKEFGNGKYERNNRASGALHSEPDKQYPKPKVYPS